MSVLIEAFTVVIRRSRLKRIHPAAVERFFENAPNKTPRADEHLVAISFMNSEDVRIYVRTLEHEAGLRYLEGGRCVDIAVVDQAQGPLAPCDWIEVSADDRGVAYSWLKGTIPGEMAVYASWDWNGKPRMQRANDLGATTAADRVYRHHARTFGASDKRLVEGRDKIQLAAREATFNEFRRRGWEACAVLRAHNPVHHLVFRRGNRLALIYVAADDETRLDAERRKKLLARAKAWRATPVLAVCEVFSPIWIKDGEVDHFDEPQVNKIKLTDLSRGRPLDESRFDHRERIEISDWELLDFGIQIVREQIERTGYVIETWTSEQNDDPHIEAIKDGQRYHVVVAAGRYPEQQPVIDRNRLVACAERAVRVGASLARAAVSFANSSDMFVGDFPLPLWRGESATIRFQGLEFVEPEVVTADRQVCIFVSSTFEDFRNERKALLQRVVPELNRRAQERDVHVTAVDLQWGVPQTDSRDNLQLAACFSEIERCSPFLIGLLGERYGWCPPAAAMERAHTPTEWDGMSITEMEIRRAIMPDFSVNRSALVYAKKSYQAVQKRRQRLARSMAQLPTREAQLKVLKQHGLYVGETKRDSGHFVKPRPRSNSKRPFENLVLDLIDRGAAIHLLDSGLERRVLDDAWTIIDKHFPADPDANPVSRSVRRHRRFGFAQAQAFDASWPTLRLLADAARQLVPTRAAFGNSWEAAGIAGVIAREARQIFGVARVFEFHCGLSRVENRLEELLGGLLAYIGPTLDQQITVPAGIPARISILKHLLDLAANTDRPPVVIVVSEADLLSHASVDALSPLRASTFTRLIETRVGTDGRAAWSVDERRAFLERTMRRRGRAIEVADMERVATHPMSTDLLFLRFVSAFLDHWAVHQTLGSEISRALSVATWGDVAALVRLGGGSDDIRSIEVPRVLARKLLGSADGIDAAQLILEPGLNGRVLFEARSRIEFLISEWSGRWRLSRGEGTETVVRALVA